MLFPVVLMAPAGWTMIESQRQAQMVLQRWWVYGFLCSCLAKSRQRWTLASLFLYSTPSPERLLLESIHVEVNIEV